MVWRETGVDGAHGLSTSEVEEMTHLRETSDCPGYSRPHEPPAGQRESSTQQLREHASLQVELSKTTSTQDVVVKIGVDERALELAVRAADPSPHSSGPRAAAAARPGRIRRLTVGISRAGG